MEMSIPGLSLGPAGVYAGLDNLELRTMGPYSFSRLFYGWQRLTGDFVLEVLRNLGFVAGNTCGVRLCSHVRFDH